MSYLTDELVRRGHDVTLFASDDGVTGYIDGAVAGAVESVTRLASIRRGDCRRAFTDRFTAARMAEDDLETYRVLDGETLEEATAA